MINTCLSMYQAMVMLIYQTVSYTHLPTNLHPLSPEQKASKTVKLMGGKENVFAACLLYTSIAAFRWNCLTCMDVKQFYKFMRKMLKSVNKLISARLPELQLSLIHIYSVSLAESAYGMARSFNTSVFFHA